MAVSNHLGLYLPTRDDYISVKRDLSDNFELIDASAEMLEKGLAIPVNGDTAPAALSVGQCILLKNHSTLANGAYFVTQAMSASETISGSKVSAISNGIANELNSKLPMKSSTTLTTSNLSSNISTAGASYVKNGRNAIINLSCTANRDIAVGQDVTFKISGMKSYGGGYGVGYSGSTCGVVKLAAGTGNDMNVAIRITGSAFLNQYSLSACVSIIVDE